MAYPTTLDSFTNPSAISGDTLASVPHDSQHTNANNAIVALETKVGINASAVTTTIDYLLKNSASIDPGHHHTNSTLDSIASSKITGVTFPSGTIVGTTDTQTLTNKILPKIQGAASGAQFVQAVGEYSNGNSGTTITIDLSKGDRQSVTLTGNCTFTWSNPSQGQSVILRVVEDGTGGRTITLPSGKWPNGVAGTFTTTASAINLLVIYYDGTNYLYQLSAGFA